MATKTKAAMVAKETVMQETLDMLNGFEVIELAPPFAGGKTESLPAVTITDKGRVVLSKVTSVAVVATGATWATILRDPKVTKGFRLALRFTIGQDPGIKLVNQCEMNVNKKTGVVGLGLAATIGDPTRVGYEYKKWGTHRFLLQDEGKDGKGQYCVTFSIPETLTVTPKIGRPGRKTNAAKAAAAAAAANASAEPVTLTEADVASAAA